MKASLSEYMKSLSGSELSILEEVISKKYRKFMKFFSLVSDFSDNILSLKYNFTDQNTLDIELGLKNTDSDIKTEIKEEMIASGYKIESRKNKKNKKLKLVIIYDESNMF